MTPTAWLVAGLALLLGAAGGYLLGRRSGREPAVGERAPLGPMPLGLLAGAVFAALVGGGFLWLSDSEPNRALEAAHPAPMSSPPATAPSPPATGSSPPATGSSGLSPALAELDSHILANPEDLGARREMALMLLSEQRFMDALGQTDQILARQPHDPTALYVQAVVRLNMGQRERGRMLLEQAIDSDPRHVHALIALGRFHLQEGQTGEALSVLETALDAAGGNHSGIERMIAEAGAGAGAANP